MEGTLVPDIFEPSCEKCPWDKEFPDELYKLNVVMLLQDAGKQVPHDELTDIEWLALGALQRERGILTAKDNKDNRSDGN